MNIPSRREFLTSAVAATLASGCKTDQTKADRTETDKTHLPLVVDVIGPMAFQWCGNEFELWMPAIDQYPHEAGIMTSVTSFDLLKGDYRMSGPSSSNSKPTVHQTSGGQVYQVKVTDSSAANNKYIHMSLPMPRLIVVLDPVLAAVYPTKAKPQPLTFQLYAVGVRLRYDHAGEPTLHDSQGVSHLVPNGKIPFDAAPGETQLNMLIGYEANDNKDADYQESRESFHQISTLFPPLDLQVEFAPQSASESPNVVSHRGIFRDCRSLVIGVC